jgi:AraC-like DNA-binding protein
MRELIESRYDGPLTLAELSEAAGLSRFHALRQFRARFGLPPHAYLQQLRVRRARALILAGDALAETAFAVGFADQAHMTRAFRRTLGYTPGVLSRS